jgi:hypothetical protein
MRAGAVQATSQGMTDLRDRMVHRRNVISAALAKGVACYGEIIARIQ